MAMKSPGVMAFGSSVGMVVSWVFLVFAGRRCDYTLCRVVGFRARRHEIVGGLSSCGAHAGVVAWYSELARRILPRPTPAGDKPPRYIFPLPHPSGLRLSPE